MKGGQSGSIEIVVGANTGVVLHVEFKGDFDWGHWVFNSRTILLESGFTETVTTARARFILRWGKLTYLPSEKIPEEYRPRIKIKREGFNIIELKFREYILTNIPTIYFIFLIIFNLTIISARLKW